MIIHPPRGEEGDMEVEARGVEGPIVVVAIGGFEVASILEFRGVPKSAPEICEDWEHRP